MPREAETVEVIEPVDVVVTDWAMPPEEIIEDIELVDTPAGDAALEPGDYLPTTPDVPSVELSGEMTQTWTPTPVVPRTDLRLLTTIPLRPGTGLVGAGGDGPRFFDPDQLDQRPQATFQPAPTFPFEMRREAAEATVLVEFVVDAKGKVGWARVLESSHRGFEAAAIAGVSRWRFKPGMKGGRAVSTRMRVPIVFSLSD